MEIESHCMKQDPPSQPRDSRDISKVSELTIDVYKTLDQPSIGKHDVEDLATLSSGVMVLRS
ncbi:hypothetical protein BGZ65_002010, partial [Modicella reniformis]